MAARQIIQSIPLPARLMLVVLVLGVVAAGTSVAVLQAGGKTITSSQLQQDIQDIVLRRSETPGQPDGGTIGPWWLSARAVEPATGDFVDLKFHSGNVHLAARRARVVLDADDDTLRIELFDLVLTRLTDGDDESEKPGGLHFMDRYTLGPVEYSMNIVRR